MTQESAPLFAIQSLVFHYSEGHLALDGIDLAVEEKGAGLGYPRPERLESAQQFIRFDLRAHLEITESPVIQKTPSLVLIPSLSKSFSHASLSIAPSALNVTEEHTLVQQETKARSRGQGTLQTRQPPPALATGS